eukprot:TRINITY_DN89342_c0_g1_i1.p1 TRINITY_DN89342_c0_g1~~TRINITY_DN89342_c0_g1_i1.p1  ORF type:complete len:565 (+),score=140.45 TRINITY_DN89342_c0_g1_i1:75-1769(+)
MTAVGPSLAEVAAAKLREAKRLVRLERTFDAEKVAGDAKALFEKLSDSNGNLQALRLLISAAVVEERFDDALTQAEAELATAKSSSNKVAQAYMLMALVEIYLAKGLAEKALETAKEAEEHLLALDDKQCAGELLLLVAAAHLAQGGGQASLNASLQAVDLFSESKDAQGECGAWCGVMKSRLALGKYEDALRAAEAALVVASDAHDELGQAMALLTLAQTHNDYGQSQKGRKAAEKAVSLFKLQSSEVLTAKAMDTYVSAMIDQKLAPEALKFCKQEVSQIVAGGDKRAVPIMRTCLVRLYAFMDKKKQALAEAEKALASSEELGSRRNQAVALQHIAQMNLLLGNIDVAKQKAEQAAALCRDLGDMLGETLATDTIGKTVEHRGVFEERAEKDREAEVLIHRLKTALQDRDGDEFRIVLEKCYAHGHVYTDDVEEALRPVVSQDPDSFYEFYEDNQPQQSKVDYTNRKFSTAQMFDRMLMYYIFRWGNMGYGPGFRLQQTTYRVGAVPGHETSESAASLALMEDAPDWEEKTQWHAGILDCVLQTSATRYQAANLPDKMRIH